MKGSIPRPFIDDLLTKANIVDVVKPVAIIKPVALFTTKKRLLSPLAKKNSSIIASDAVLTAMPFLF